MIEWIKEAPEVSGTYRGDYLKKYEDIRHVFEKLCLTAALTMLFTGLLFVMQDGMSVSASESGQTETSLGTLEDFSLSDDSAADTDVTVSAVIEEETGNSLFLNSTLKVYGASSVSGVNFGEQITSLSNLTEVQGLLAKRIYDALSLLSSSNSDANSYASIEDNRIIITLNVSFEISSSYPTSSEREEIEEYLLQISQVATDAFFRDYPEVFWVDVNNSPWGYTSSNRAKYEGGTYYFTVSYLYLDVEAYSMYSTDHTVDYYIEQVSDAIENFQVSGSTRYEQVKSIHDTLCNTVVYKESDGSHQLYGALITGEAVCEGYAKAFKAICDTLDIPCVLVSGNSVSLSGAQSAHMWNYVQMDDGCWYAVDVTWDDGNSIYYDYFLCGSDSYDEHFGKRLFSETHIADGDFNGTGAAEFTYPTLAQDAYDVNWNTVTMPVRELPEGRSYGDVNGDGAVDVTDALLVLQIYVNLTQPEDETAEIAADVTGDWNITVSDALYILKKYVNLTEYFPVELALM